MNEWYNIIESNKRIEFLKYIHDQMQGKNGHHHKISKYIWRFFSQIPVGNKSVQQFHATRLLKQINLYFVKLKSKTFMLHLVSGISIYTSRIVVTKKSSDSENKGLYNRSEQRKPVSL